MTFDPHRNLVISGVRVAPSPALSGTTLQCDTGEGILFPDPAVSGAFNCTIYPIGQTPTLANAEIVRVTGRSVDAFTIVRAQEGTVAQPINANYQIGLTITAKAFQDLESAAPLSGAGVPEGVVTASPGAIYRRTDPTLNVSPLWIKATGAGNTGWRSFDRARIDVEDWGADGTGVADSSPVFTMILALAGENAVIYSKPNRTYKIKSRLLINKASVWEFNGSVIQADATLANDAVAVTAANVTIIGMVVDGNKASGRSSQQTIRWQADKGVAINCEARNGTAGNWVLQSGTIELHGCRALNAVGINFETVSGGVSRLWDCYSEGSAFYGYYYHETAADGCFMDGCRSYLDFSSMAIISSHGEIGTFTADYPVSGGVNVVASGPRKFLTTAFGAANSNMSFVCGLPGDHTAPTINVVFVDPGAANRALAAAWTGTLNNWTLTITLATNGASSTNISDNSAARVINAIYAATPPSTASITGGSPTVNDPHLVEVTLEPGNDGTGIVGTMVSTPLAGGSGHTPYGWTIGTMIQRRTGYNLDGTIHTASGTAYTFGGCSDFQIGTLIAKDVQGYGVSFAATGSPRIPACRVDIGTVVVSNLEALDGGDPGLAVQMGCFDITVGDLIVNGFTWGVSIGDSDGVSYGAPPSGFRGLSDGTGGGGPVPARDLKIGRIQANRCVTGVMVVDHGRRIRVGPIQATDCGTNLSHGVGGPIGYGLLSFNGTGIFTTGCSVNVGVNPNALVLPGPVTTYYYYQKNARVKITGVGPAGADLVTRVTALSGSTLTLADVASTTNASATIQLLDVVVDDITVESFEHLVTERIGRWQDLPINLVYCDPLATNIKVRYKALGCREAPVRDDNGGNKFYAEWPERVRQLASADSTETWTAGGAGATVVDNTTTGQYSEGTGGKKISAAAGVSGSGASPVFGPFDLSALPDETWFRLGVYVENFADAAGSGIRVRLKSGVTTYDEIARMTPARIYRDGLYYLHFRKRDIDGTSSGGAITRLNWAAVNQLEVVLNNTAGNFKVTVDDFVQLGPTFAERQAVPAVDTPMIRLGNGQTPLLEPLVTTGSGSPETVVAAPPASMYLDVTGGVWYRKTSGFAKTGWLLLTDPTFDAAQQLMGETAYPPFDPALLPSTGTPVLGFFFATLMRVFAGKTVTSLVYNMVTQGAGTTLVKVAAYPTAGGSALATSADNSAAFNNAANASTWLKTDFSPAYTPTQDGWVYGGFVVVGGTAPVLTRNLVVQLGKPRKAGGLRLCVQHNVGALTDLPGTFTPADSSHLYGPVGI